MISTNQPRTVGVEADRALGAVRFFAFVDQLAGLVADQAADQAADPAEPKATAGRDASVRMRRGNVPPAAFATFAQLWDNVGRN